MAQLKVKICKLNLFRRSTKDILNQSHETEEEKLPNFHRAELYFLFYFLALISVS